MTDGSYYNLILDKIDVLPEEQKVNIQVTIENISDKTIFAPWALTSPYPFILHLVDDKDRLIAQTGFTHTFSLLASNRQNKKLEAGNKLTLSAELVDYYDCLFEGGYVFSLYLDMTSFFENYPPKEGEEVIKYGTKESNKLSFNLPFDFKSEGYYKMQEIKNKLDWKNNFRWWNPQTWWRKK